MIGVHEFDQSEPPEAPLKSWRSKFEMNNLTTGDLMKFFQISAPQYFSIDQTAEYAELGNFFDIFCKVIGHFVYFLYTYMNEDAEVKVFFSHFLQYL